MKRMSRAVRIVSEAGMELGWLYAWATFSMCEILDGPYPLPQAMGTFALAAVLTAAGRGRGWRIVHILLLHAAGWCLFVSGIVHLLLYPNDNFWSRAWLLDFWQRSHDPVTWLFIIFLSGWVTAFWAAGVRLMLRPQTYLMVCSRFDLGISAFFVLLIIKLMMRVQMKITLSETLSEWMLFPFFVFALFSIVVARGQGPGHTDFKSGYRGIGLIFSFGMVLVSMVSGLGLFFLPYLQQASAAGLEILKVVTRPLGPVVVSVLRFLLTYGHSAPARGGAEGGFGAVAGAVPAGSSGWMDMLMKLAVWGAFMALGVMLAVMVCVGSWFLLRWLLSRTVQNDRPARERHPFLDWLDRFLSAVFDLYGRFFDSEETLCAASFYRKLLGWGRRSGLPHRPAETPLEYARRLKSVFAPVNTEIDLIVALFNREMYAQTPASRQQLDRARQALRQIRHPGLWPGRLKMRMLGSR